MSYAGSLPEPTDSGPSGEGPSSGESIYRALFEHMEEGVALHEVIYAEKMLRASEARYRLLADNMADVIWILDVATMRFTYVSPSIERLRGFTVDEAMAQSIDQVMTPASLAMVGGALPARLQAFLAGDSSVRVQTDEIEQTCKNGTTVWTEVVTTLTRDDTGAIQVVGASRDITWRRQGDQALRESESKLRTLFEILPIGVSILDADRRIIYMNPALESILGLPRKDVLAEGYRSRGYIKRDHTPMSDYELASVRAIADQRPVHNVETGMVKDDGTVIWTNVNAVPVAFSDWRVVVVTSDITERIVAEEALQKKDELLHMTGEMAKVGGWEFDVATRKGTWTDVVARIHDLDPGQETNVELGVGFYTDQSRTQIENAIEEAITSARSYDLELEMTTATGQHKWVRTVGLPVSQDGRVIKVRGTFQDITERKRAEDILHASERRFRTLFENMVEGFAYCHMLYENGEPQDFVYLDVNASFEQLTGLKNVIGKKVSEVIPGLRMANPELFDVYGRVAMSGVPERLETYLPALNMWLSITSYSIEREYFVAVFDNISERKRVEGEIRSALAEKETLLREVHHRVKNNLQAMIALMDMQAGQLPDEASKQFLKELEGQARTMSLVYEQLYQSETLASVSMAPYLQQLASNILEAFGGGRAISLHLDAPVTLDVAQAMPCGLIVNELLTNALKHAFPPGMADRPAIRVTLHPEGNVFRLTVTDNGTGLPPGYDWRSARTLGLRLVRLWATHQLGGTLEVTGDPGACYTITFGV